jgi:acetyl-CoA carboxylase biotin carboxylase subunit
MFKKILIANRGEIALRILRAARELGIKTVAVHSEVDARALHVRFADEAVCIGPAPAAKSYLNIPAIISAAEITAADAIHPGYGFLSENAEFARICGKCGITFIGPTPEAMRAWGDKVTARKNAERFGLPLLNGSEVLENAEHAIREANRIGYPVILKASGGGGGRGMRIVRSDSEMPDSFGSARREAETGFKNPDVYCEKFVERPRHIEFQVFADQHGGVWTLGERECSLQRRHQKVIEEGPSPAMTPELRAEMTQVIHKAVSSTGYTSLGTLEFLMDEKRNLYFLEMNTRVQVEHPVTELITGLDLVSLQIRAAAGEKMSPRLRPGSAEAGEQPGQDTRPWPLQGHAIECRINAEDPKTFAPWPGLITEWAAPGGNGVRVDSGVYGGWRVPADYDSLLAKLIVHAPTRREAIVRMRRALDEFIVGGIRTNIDLHKALLADQEVLDGMMSTRTVDRITGRGH